MIEMAAKGRLRSDFLLLQGTPEALGSLEPSHGGGRLKPGGWSEFRGILGRVIQQVEPVLGKGERKHAGHLRKGKEVQARGVLR